MLVVFNIRLVNLDAQTGIGGQLDDTVDGLDDVAGLDRVTFVGQRIFENGKVGQARRRVDGRGGPHRSVRIVWRDLHEVGFRHRADFQQFFDAATVANIWLNNVDELLFEHLPLAPLRESALTGRNVHRQSRLSYVDERGDAIGWDRLFEETQVKRLKCLS